MRPKSIILFERLLWLSLILSVIDLAFNWQALITDFSSDPAWAGSDMGTWVGATTMAMGFALYIALGYSVARRGSRVAKWILVAFTAFGVASMALLPMALPADELDDLWVSLLSNIAMLAAVAMLFRRDAVEWLKGPQVVAETFQ